MRVSGRRRRFRVVLAVLMALVVAFVLRATVLAPRYDVASIAGDSRYQAPSLLDRAWALPVARTYGGHIVRQSNGSVCGPATLANAFRSLGDPASTQASVLDGSGMCWTGLCIPGLTLDEIAALARSRTPRRVTVLRDLDLEGFRAHMKRANDPSRRYLVNFHRGLLFGKGVGHHSPVGGYLEDDDLVLVLDVNGAFGPWLVATERLFRAVDSTDGSTGKKRGLVLIE